MGRGNNPQPQTQYVTALNEAKEPSEAEKKLNEAALKTLNWADKGDFTNPREGGLFVNYADPAMLHRNRELTTNAGGQGVFGLGVADPNYLATLKANQAANDEATDAAQYESDIQSGISDAATVAGDTAKMDLSRKMSILGTTSDVYKAKMAQPKWWESLIQGVATAGAGALSNPAVKI